VPTTGQDLGLAYGIQALEVSPVMWYEVYIFIYEPAILVLLISDHENPRFECGLLYLLVYYLLIAG
jgi:hypothetical protein